MAAMAGCADDDKDTDSPGGKADAAQMIEAKAGEDVVLSGDGNSVHIIKLPLSETMERVTWTLEVPTSQMIPDHIFDRQKTGPVVGYWQVDKPMDLDDPFHPFGDGFGSWDEHGSSFTTEERLSPYDPIIDLISPEAPYRHKTLFLTLVDQGASYEDVTLRFTVKSMDNQKEDETNNSIAKARVVKFADPTAHITGTLSSASDEDYFLFEDPQLTQCFVVQFAARVDENQEFDWIGGEPAPSIEMLFPDGMRQAWYDTGFAKMTFNSKRYIKLSGLNGFHGDYEILAPKLSAGSKYCDHWGEQGDLTD